MRAFFWLLSVALFVCYLPAIGQAPPGINYQAVARDKEGKALVSKDISVRISILQDNENGETEYAEKHSLKTNPFGLFMLVIGHGETLAGNFEFISWAVGNKWLRIELDPDGGNFFQLMGAQQLMSVPYAFYAKYSGNGYVAGPGISINNSIITNTGDADNNPANETITQVALTSDNKLRITEAGGTKEADLSSLVGDGQNLQQVLTLGNSAGATRITDLATPTAGADAATKSYVDNHTDSDADTQNEIQDLNLTGNVLKVTKNGSATGIDLTPYLDNTDSQSLAVTGTSLSISGGNSVNLATINTDNQNLTVTTTGTQHSIGISNGTGITIDVADNDNNATNEIQDLALNANQLSITNNSTPTVINLAPYLDNTDSQTLGTQSVDANTRSLSVSGGNVINVDVRDADFSTTNEIQDLARTGNTLSLTNDATTVDLSPYLDNTDAQTLATASVDANTRSVTVSGGNTVNVDVRDADFSTTNEIQDLTRTGNTLSLTSDGTTVDLSPYLDNTDAQTLSTTSVDANTRSVTVSGGNTVNVDVRDADFSTTNEIQDLTRTGNTLSLTSDGTTVDLSPYLDNTDSQTLATASVDANTRSVTVSGGNTVNVDVRDADFSTTNEIQDLTRTGNTLSLTSDGTTVDLSPYLDNTDAQSLTYDGGTKALSISGGNSVTITETQTLAQVLTNGNSAGSQQITNVAAPTANNDAATKKYVDDADAILASRISTTYAFKTAFAYTNSSGIVTNDQTIPFSTEDFDDFNVLATNQFTASEAGVYVFGVDGSYFAALAGGQLSLLYNGTKYPIAILQPWGSALARYNATMMLKLNAGQTVTLVADNVLAGAQFNGTFFGYKL